MFDLYLFNTIINTLWYLFTILFVLYKYTAFFSYIYNFVKFCGKLFLGVSYIYKYIYNFRSNRFDIESQNNNVIQQGTFNEHQDNKTFYQKCKNYITKNYNYYNRKIFSGAEVTLPLVETNYSSQIKLSTQLFDNKEKEQKLFNQKMNELEDSELELEEHNCYINNQNNGVKFKTYDYTPLAQHAFDDDVLFDKNFKTEYINSSGTYNEERQCTLGSFLKNKSVTINKKLNVSYESKRESDSDIEIDSDIELNSDMELDSELNSSNTIFYDL